MKKITFALIVVLVALLVLVLNRKHADPQSGDAGHAPQCTGTTVDVVPESEAPPQETPGAVQIKEVADLPPEAESVGDTEVDSVETLDAQEPDRPVPPLIAAVTDPDNPRRKWLAVHELPGQHTAADTALLAAYLVDNPIGAAEYMGEEFAHRNYIMDVLREQVDSWPLVVDSLVRIYEEPRQGDVLQGYALQHLASLYIDNPQALPDTLKQRIIETFRGALPQREEGTLASTALIGLHEIERVDDAAAVTAREIERAVMDLLLDPASGNLARISALQIAGERGLTEAIPEARRRAVDPGQDWVVRMAAVWVLGQSGTNSDLIRQLADDPDENVRNAARSALKEI